MVIFCLVGSMKCPLATRALSSHVCSCLIVCAACKINFIYDPNDNIYLKVCVSISNSNNLALLKTHNQEKSILLTFFSAQLFLISFVEYEKKNFFLAGNEE